MDNFDPFEFSFGKIGESVPVVDPDDIRAVARETRELTKAHPGEQFAIGRDALATFCKPGANMKAICYRHMSISMLSLIAQTAVPTEAKADEEFLEFRRKITPIFQQNGELIDAAYDVAANIPMVWTKQGLPFDPDEFLRLCAAK